LQTETIYNSNASIDSAQLMSRTILMTNK